MAVAEKLNTGQAACLQNLWVNSGSYDPFTTMLA
jgi:hypothetical protein